MFVQLVFTDYYVIFFKQRAMIILFCFLLTVYFNTLVKTGKKNSFEILGKKSL